ncbi:MAG: efflux RND transporter periplasmic adaptor subunit [Parcubacteria group bacterium]|jgi:RND family efflux transporter MFP subunit
MPKRKTIIWIVIGAAVLIGIVYFAFLRKPKVQYNTAEAKKGGLTETVSVTGTLKSNDTISLDFETNGRVRAVNVKVGQKVAKGDLIGSLDDSSLQLEVDQAKANLEKAQADAGISFDTIHSAEVGKRNAEKYLEDTKSLNKKNITSAEQKVSDAKNYLEDAQSYYNQVKSDDGADSSTTKSARLTLDTAESSYNAAKKALDVADQTADLSETSAQNSLDTAEATRDAAKSKYIAASKDANVASFEAAYQSALVDMDRAVLRAPANGIIKEVNFKTGEVIGGTSVEAFAKMISYDFVLEAKVSESDIAKIKLDQKATLTFDAFDPDEKFTASVVSIDPSSTVVQDVVDYVVKLAMDKDDLRLKDGMSADLDVLVFEKNDVLAIQERSIKDVDGKKIVQILEKGNPVDREVKTGAKGDGGMIEIISGLKEGDMVITSTK